MRYLVPKQVTEAGFSKFGSVIRVPDRKHDLESDLFSYWHDVADLSALECVIGNFSLLRTKRIPVELVKMDHLSDSVRVYLPNEGSVSILFVGENDPAKDEAVEGSIEAFILEDGIGVMVKEKVWHWTPLPLTRTATILMAIRTGIVFKDKGGQFNIDFSRAKYHELKETIGIRM